ncbi:MAG: hypothetical protein QOE71_4243 [Pseudonocardiales bacterium]|nr:hypothetical protein [Pseudonocardiales bacterium]
MTSPGKGIGSVIRRRIVSDEGLGTDTVWQNCTGLYEKAAKASALTEEPTDAPCFPKGDPQGRRTAPSLVRGCANFDSEGDLDFDGTSYWPDWPNATKPTPLPVTVPAAAATHARCPLPPHTVPDKRHAGPQPLLRHPQVGNAASPHCRCSPVIQLHRSGYSIPAPGTAPADPSAPVPA